MLRDVDAVQKLQNGLLQSFKCNRWLMASPSVDLAARTPVVDIAPTGRLDLLFRRNREPTRTLDQTTGKREGADGRTRFAGLPQDFLGAFELLHGDHSG